MIFNSIVIRVSFFIFFFQQLTVSSSSPSTNSTSIVQKLIQSDTIIISPNVNAMIFNFYGNSNVYVNSNGAKLGRFEVYYLGDSIPFQKDTVDNVLAVEYEDANFDGTLDIKITTEMDFSDGSDQQVYYIYNIGSKKFEQGLEGLNFEINKGDSTIISSWQMDRWKMGWNKVYRYSNGIFVLIGESEISEEKSFRRNIIGDSLVTTSLQVLSNIGNNKYVDSTFNYIFGKLRVTYVTIKLMLNRKPTSEELKNEVALEDYFGLYFYQSKEHYNYKKGKNNSIWCLYKSEISKNGKWTSAKNRQWTVQE